MRRISVTAFILLLSAAFVFGGCGREEEAGDSVTMDSDAEDSTEESGADAEEPDVSLKDTEHYSDVVGVAGNAVQLVFEGENAEKVNGRIAAIAPCQSDYLIAQTTDGNLFLVKPDIAVYLDQFAVEAHQITDSGRFDSLSYADSHVAYGQESLAYFEMREDYSEENIDALVEDYSDIEAYYDMVTQLVFVFDNLQEKEFADADGLILVTADADFCVYADKSGKVHVDYKGDDFSRVTFVGDGTEREDVEAQKAIYQFILTKDKELLLIRQASAAEAPGGQVENVSLGYMDLAVGEKIDSPVRDIFNVRMDEDYCYAVDEENRIWYVGYDWLDHVVTAEQVAQLPDGVITDVQGFGGMHDIVMIGTEDGSWYYTYYDGLQKVDGLDAGYKKAVNISDQSVIALRDDGWLYSVGL